MPEHLKAAPAKPHDDPMLDRIVREGCRLRSQYHERRLKAAFSFQDIYMGLSPFDAPATFSLMPYTELAHGVWYPSGGMYRVVEALMDLARAAGVEFIFDAAVQQIETDAAHARRVRLADGTRFDAEVVVANADLPYVYQTLLPLDGTAEALSRARARAYTDATGLL